MCSPAVPVHPAYSQLHPCKTTPSQRQTWSGRFSEPVDELVKRYTASVGFDQRLAEFDIQGSLAHARMLHSGRRAVGRRTWRTSSAAWRRSCEEIHAGRFQWSLDLEDVHLNIEKRLTDLVGDAGKRLHTGRSRNDQVATDVRLWLRAAIDEHRRADPRAADCGWSTWPSTHADTVMPGLHPSAGGPAGELRPSPAGLLRDAQARPRTAGRLPQARQPAAAGRGGAGRHHLSDRPRDGGARARLRRRLRQLAGRGLRSRLRHRVLRLRRAAS